MTVRRSSNLWSGVTVLIETPVFLDVDGFHSQFELDSFATGITWRESPALNASDFVSLMMRSIMDDRVNS